MNLDERLKVSENKGYISVNVESELYYFFIEINDDIRVGDIIDYRNKQFRVNKIINKSRISAEEI